MRRCDGDDRFPRRRNGGPAEPADHGRGDQRRRSTSGTPGTSATTSPRWAPTTRRSTCGGDLTPADVDIAELYDGFSYLTLQWIEALGFCEHGKAGEYVDGGGRIALDGELPINTQGGQLSGGRLHGVGFLHEACTQLWGRGGARQVARRPRVAAVAAGGGPVSGCMLVSRRD